MEGGELKEKTRERRRRVSRPRKPAKKNQEKDKRII